MLEPRPVVCGQQLVHLTSAGALATDLLVAEVCFDLSTGLRQPLDSLLEEEMPHDEKGARRRDSAPPCGARLRSHQEVAEEEEVGACPRCRQGGLALAHSSSRVVQH